MLHDHLVRFELRALPLQPTTTTGTWVPGSWDLGSWARGYRALGLALGAKDLGLGEWGLRPGAKGLRDAARGGQVQKMQPITNVLTRCIKCSK